MMESAVIRNLAGRSDDAAAPIPEAVAIARNRDCRAYNDVVRKLQIGRAAEMDIQHQNCWGGLWKLVSQLVSNTQFH